MLRTRLLIDADIVAFTAASAAQGICTDHDLVFPVASKKLGEALAENIIAGLKIELGAEEVWLILSDPQDNWRRDVDPEYKRNRVGERPLLLDYLKEWLRVNHGATHWERLEADDTLSLMATAPGCTPNTVIVGRDKDFKSIPGRHHAYNQDPPGVVREISLEEADRFHWAQTLAGDRIDGFYGCKGIGMTRAHQIVSNPVRLVPKESIKTRGVNKGDSTTRWEPEPTMDMWECIVSHYQKAGQTEADALRTARLAHLLRHGEYQNGKVTLWQPKRR